VRPRIAVSGVGVVSALGQTADETFRALLAGERGLGPLDLFDPGDVRSRLVGQVRDLRPSEVAFRERAAECSRTDAMAVAAAKEAARRARLPAGARLGVVLGGTTGGMLETESLLSGPGAVQVSPARAAELISYPLSASLLRVAEAFGGAARTRSICSACSGGAIALVQAVAWLTRGEVDYVLAGGADGLCRLTVLGFNALGATDPAPCRPFDRSRAGLNLGEGAGVLVLEREDTAVSRGAEILAWLDGYAIGAEGHHITHPEPSGARAAGLMRSALARAQLAAEDVAYVNAHGTGTQQNDAMEARALREVLGDGSAAWISSSKAQLGHTLGAAGAIEAAITVLAIERRVVPPSVGLVDPELSGLRYARETGITGPIGAALSSSFGFGGMSCVLAFTAGDRDAPTAPSVARRIVVLGGSVLDAATEPATELDAERSRRFDRGSAQAAAGVLRVVPPGQGDGVGLVLGTAFGNVERTMAFLARARERGARLVPPAEFPHLVPSAPAGNASVYAGLTGPVFAVSELSQSGDAAFATACDLLELGLSTQMVAGGIAPRDQIVDRVLGPLHQDTDGERGDGAAFLLLADEDTLSTEVQPSASLLGRYAGSELGQVPERPPSAALVVLGAADAATRLWLERSTWRDAPRRDLVTEHAHHEALGAVALAVAVEAIARHEVERALVLSGGGGRASAVLLGAAAPRCQ
jgi:3-oxoacyl-[acyl-carrier-protein] synthase II